jgi:hypothetical protein
LIFLKVFDHDNFGDHEFLGGFKRSISTIPEKLPDKPGFILF